MKVLGQETGPHLKQGEVGHIRQHLWGHLSDFLTYVLVDEITLWLFFFSFFTFIYKEDPMEILNFTFASGIRLAERRTHFLF